MSTGTGPVIGRLEPRSGKPRRGALADVLIGTADRRSSARRCADLFGRYPGLTLVLLLRAGGPGCGHRSGGLDGYSEMPFDGAVRLSAGLRDGLLLSLRSGRAHRCAPPRIGDVARWLYLRWSTGTDLTGSAGRELADAAGIRLSARVDRWTDGTSGSLPSEIPGRFVELAAETERT